MTQLDDEERAKYRKAFGILNDIAEGGPVKRKKRQPKTELQKRFDARAKERRESRRRENS